MSRLRPALLLVAAVLTLLATGDWLGGEYLVQGVAQEYGVVDLATTAAAGVVVGLCLLGVHRPARWSVAAAAVGLAFAGYDLWLRLAPTTGYVLLDASYEEPRPWQVDAGLLLVALSVGLLLALLVTRRYDRRRTR